MKTILLVAIVALVVPALGYRDDIEYNQWEGKMQAFLDHFQEEADADMKEDTKEFTLCKESSICNKGLTGEPDEKENAAMDLYNIMKDDTVPDETGPPSDVFMREIMDQPVPADDQIVYNQLSAGDEIHQTVPSTAKAVFHGSSVTFQLLYSKRYFIGCTQNPCIKAVCPHLYMEGNDWNTCRGEVFRIYRFRGPGQVRAGEAVAFYYTGEPGQWFGCSGLYCGKATCPGNPTLQYGMQNIGNWFHCQGEVFKIYARGKPLGAPIYANDDIMLFYLQEQKWIGHIGSYPAKGTCPGVVRPPPPSRYDICWGENFELWMR